MEQKCTLQAKRIVCFRARCANLGERNIRNNGEGNIRCTGSLIVKLQHYCRSALILGWITMQLYWQTLLSSLQMNLMAYFEYFECIIDFMRQRKRTYFFFLLGVNFPLVLTFVRVK